MASRMWGPGNRFIKIGSDATQRDVRRNKCDVIVRSQEHGKRLICTEQFLNSFIQSQKHLIGELSKFVLKRLPQGFMCDRLASKYQQMKFWRMQAAVNAFAIDQVVGHAIAGLHRKASIAGVIAKRTMPIADSGLRDQWEEPLPDWLEFRYEAGDRRKNLCANETE